MTTLLAAGLFLIAFLTLVGCYVIWQSNLTLSQVTYLTTVDLFMIAIEVLSALALLGTIG